MSTSEGSLSRSMANLRRLRLHLNVWSGDTRSILLQPMGRMERTDSRPRDALIHHESWSPADSFHTPGSSFSTGAHITVRTASRFHRGHPALRARFLPRDEGAKLRSATHEWRHFWSWCRVYIYLLRIESRYSGEIKGVVRSRQKSGPGPVQDAGSDLRRTDLMVRERKHGRQCAVFTFQCPNHNPINI